VFAAHVFDHLLQDYGYGLVFAVICLEAMGLPLPGESMIIGATVYAVTTGRLHVVLVVASAAAGAIVGDNFGYMLGRWAGFPLLQRYGRYVGLNDRRLTLGRSDARLFIFEIWIGRWLSFITKNNPCCATAHAV